MSLLDGVHGPADLKRLAPEQLPLLAAELRDLMVDTVSRTGGHLGPSLGVVELTLALHRVFDSPRDKVVWDTGHQSYVHKLVTGRRREAFETLRKKGGLSGYPSRAESEHDLVENSHASTALSYADGLAKAYRLRGEHRHVVAVVGDGALTGGMCWEALNNIAASNLPVVIVVNDNGRSYSPTIGGLADHLATLRMTQAYERALDTVKTTLSRTPVVGTPLYTALHGLKRGIKDFLQPQVLFEDLGMKYLGPVDGHDTAAMEAALRRAKAFGGPVIVHAVTVKGYGYQPAVDDEADRLHSVAPVTDPVTGKPITPSAARLDRRARRGDGRDRRRPSRRRRDHRRHAAAGRACSPSARPTPSAPSTSASPSSTPSRAPPAWRWAACTRSSASTRRSSTGPSTRRSWTSRCTGCRSPSCSTAPASPARTAPSHHGMWDMSLLQLVPGMRLAAPRDARDAARGAARGARRRRRPDRRPLPQGRRRRRHPGARADRRRSTCCAAAQGDDVLLVAVGSMARLGLEVADRAAEQGIGVTVVDPRWVSPVAPELVELAAVLPPGRHRRGQRPRRRRRLAARAGPARRRRRRAAARHGHPAALPRPRDPRRRCWPRSGSRAQEVARRVVETVARLDGREGGELTDDATDDEHGRRARPIRADEQADRRS